MTINHSTRSITALPITAALVVVLCALQTPASAVHLHTKFLTLSLAAFALFSLTAFAQTPKYIEYGGVTCGDDGNFATWFAPACDTRFAVSHVVVVDVCPEAVIDTLYHDGSYAAPDPTLGLTGWKWDVTDSSNCEYTLELNECPTETEFSEYGIKAGEELYYGIVETPALECNGGGPTTTSTTILTTTTNTIADVCEEDCENRIDDNGDGLVDCEDPLCCSGECGKCDPILDDPATIKFRDGNDSVKIHGKLLDHGNPIRDFAISFSSGGLPVVFDALYLKQRRGKHWFVNKAAKTERGIYKLRLRRQVRDGIAVVNWRLLAYGDLSSNNNGSITTQIYRTDDPVSILTAEWEATRSGYVLRPSVFNEAAANFSCTW